MALAKERPIPHEYDPCMMMIVSPQIPFSADDPSLSLCFEEKSVNGEDAQSVINFSSLFTSCDQSLLSFEHSHSHSHSPRLISTDFNCFQTASDGWLYSESTVTEDSFDESGTQQTKRPHGGEICTAQALKTSNATNKKPKLHKSSPSKDPQSIAAKNRRERISERLKILQELVPNGSKVDLVTMLEKAISYVKFLQLQVKVLATDEFWPVQGGKAPDISQVREAIDAILSSSQRDRSSSSQ